MSLFNSKITKVLTEAPMDDPSDAVNSFLKDQGVSDNQINDINQQIDNPNNQPIDTQAAEPENEPPQQEQPQDTNTQASNQTQQDPNPDQIQSTDRYSMDADDGEPGDGMNGEDQQVPNIPDNYNAQEEESDKLKILKSLSDTEYKMNNLNCYKKFRELYRNVDASLNNNIMNITTINAKQRQIVDIVHNNLSRMLDDLDNYMIFKFGDIYEDNIIAYITYLKRYHTAMKIIRLLVDENIKSKESDNKDKLETKK